MSFSFVRLNADRGMDYFRIAKAHAVAPGDAYNFALHEWGRGFLDKAATAGSEASGLSVSAAARAEYLDGFSDLPVVGQLRGRLETSFNVPIMTQNTAPTASAVGEGKAIPAGRFDAVRTSLLPRKVASISPFSNEIFAEPKAERWIRNAINNALAAKTDELFLDPANAGSDAAPRSITYGVPSSASTGDPRTDIANLFADYNGDLRNAYVIGDKNSFVRMATYNDAAGSAIFPDLALIGGSILGIPVIVSRWQPGDSSGGSICLVDSASIAVAIDSITLTPTREGLIEQDSAPQGDSTTPTAGTATRVSLFSADATAVKGLLAANWAVIRSGGVSVVTGTQY